MVTTCRWRLVTTAHDTDDDDNIWSEQGNDHTIGWQNLNPLSHLNATLAPPRAVGEHLNYMTIVPQATGEILNYSLSR